MILYVCPTCGKWLDVSLAASFSSLWNEFMHVIKQPETIFDPAETPFTKCPYGHGTMTLVESGDRLSIRPSSRTETPPKE